jgi:hypothetical protein
LKNGFRLEVFNAPSLCSSRIFSKNSFGIVCRQAISRAAMKRRIQFFSGLRSIGNIGGRGRCAYLNRAKRLKSATLIEQNVFRVKRLKICDTVFVITSTERICLIKAEPSCLPRRWGPIPRNGKYLWAISCETALSFVWMEMSFFAFDPSTTSLIWFPSPWSET